MRRTIIRVRTLGVLKLNLRFVERRQTRALSLSLSLCFFLSLPTQVLSKQKISGGAPIPTSPEPFPPLPPPELILGFYTCLLSVPIYPKLPRFHLSTVPFHHCLRCTVFSPPPHPFLPFRPPTSTVRKTKTHLREKLWDWIRRIG